jgi:hypothetical protein
MAAANRTRKIWLEVFAGIVILSLLAEDAGVV